MQELKTLSTVTVAFAGLHLTAPAQVCVAVTDPSASFVPGVALELRPERGSVFTAITDTSGRHCFVNTAPGIYALTANHPEFEQTERQVRVRAGAAAEIALVLRVKALRQNVTVTENDSPSTSADSNADRIVVDPDTLDRLPVLGRDAIGAISDWLDPGSMGSGPATIVVDGIEVPATSVKPALIEQVRINQNPWSAEFAQPGRGRAEIITKSGTREFHGSLEGILRDSALDARNPLSLQKPDEHRRLLEATLTGPLVRSGPDSFLVSFARNNEYLQNIVVARTLAGDVRANVPAPAVENEWAAGWNRAIGESGRLSLRYEYDDEEQLEEGVGGVRLPGSGSNTMEKDHEARVAWNGLIGRIVNQLAVQVERSSARSESSLAGAPRLVVEDAFVSGSAQTDRAERAATLRLNYVVSWTAAKHVLRAGYQVPRLASYRIDDRRDALGTFRFSSLDEFAAGRPYSWSAQTAPGAIAFRRLQQGAFVHDDWQVRPNLQIGWGLRWQWQDAIAHGHGLAPRLSIAHAIGRARNTVIRAGAGLFYDTLDSDAVADVLLYDGLRVRRLLIANPAYPDPLAAQQPDSVPPNVYRFARNLRSPYLLQTSAGVEHKWGKAVGGAVQYVATRGFSRFRSRDLNAPAGPDLPRPDSRFGVVQVLESEGAMTANSLEANVRVRAGARGTVTARYRLAVRRNNTEGPDWFPADSRAPEKEWGRAESDVRHDFAAMADWEIWNALTLGCFLRVRSGTPYNLTTGRDDNGDGFARDRPPGMARNTLQASGMFSVDVRLAREFELRRLTGNKMSVRLAVDAFNLLNRANYTSFIGTLSSPYFELPSAARPARRLQASFEVEF